MRRALEVAASPPGPLSTGPLSAEALPAEARSTARPSAEALSAEAVSTARPSAESLSTAPPSVQGAVRPAAPPEAAESQRDAVVGPSLVGDVPVGAVVLDPAGAEVAVGRNEREVTGDPTAHAEVVALRRAAAALGTWRLDGCTLVVTLEPCTMCAGALVMARVATLVFGAWEPKTGAVGSLWDVVRDRRLTHRPEVYGGVLADHCANLVRDFFRGSGR
jgi:tRNA(adenine34) deaminase